MCQTFAVNIVLHKLGVFYNLNLVKEQIKYLGYRLIKSHFNYIMFSLLQRIPLKLAQWSDDT